MRIDKNRIHYIDGLRGFAALYVLVFHVAEIPNPHLQVPSLLYPVVTNGFSGVTLFFVISAFTLCYTLDGKQYDATSVKSFYIKRIFRIVPLYYAWIILMLLLSAVFVSKFELPLFGLFGYNFVPGRQEGIVWASWTLGIEMTFYLAFPFIFRFVSTLKKAVIFLILCILISILHRYLVLSYTGLETQSIYKIHLSFFTHLPVFAAGMICFFVFKSLQENRYSKRIGQILVLIATVSGVIVAYFVNVELYFMYYIMTILYGILLIGLCIAPVAIFQSKPAIFLGMISYSLYLNHPKIVWALTPVYQKIYKESPIPFYVCEFMTIVIVMIVSYFTYKLIEEPGMQVGKMVITRFNKRKFDAEKVICTTTS